VAGEQERLPDAHGTGGWSGVDCAGAGVHEFGEDATIDKLIRKYGYCGTPATLEAVKNDHDLARNLSAAAHLIHGSSEGRFRIRYCLPADGRHLTRQEIEGAHYEYGDLAEYEAKYNPTP